MDFLTFNSFLTPSVLLVFYYFGALVIPVWGAITLFKVYREYQQRPFVSEGLDLLQRLFLLFKPKHRIALILLSIGLFLLLELFWRMMFEFLFAYFDMHSYLKTLSQTPS